MEDTSTIFGSIAASLDKVCVDNEPLDESLRMAMWALIVKGRSLLEEAGLAVSRVLDVDPATRSCLLLCSGALEGFPNTNAIHLALVRDDESAPGNSAHDPYIEHDAARLKSAENVIAEAAEEIENDERIVMSSSTWLRVFVGALPPNGRRLSSGYYARYTCESRDAVVEDLALADTALEMAGGVMLERGFTLLGGGIFGLGSEEGGGGMRSCLIFVKEEPQQITAVFGAGARGAFPDVNLLTLDKTILESFCDAVGSSCFEEFGITSDLMTLSLYRVQFPLEQSKGTIIAQEEIISFVNNE